MPIVDSHPIGQRAHGSRTQGSYAEPTTVSAPAKVRILETANRLFYDEGIRIVGIDRLISESLVTKATFYKHYGSKDRLILEYVAARDFAAREQIAQIVRDASSPEKSILALTEAIADHVQTSGFRGCPFINAATEYADPRHRVREIVSEHRDWFAEIVADLFADLGHPLPGNAGDDFVLARDGAMTGGSVGDPIAASTGLRRTAQRIIREAKKK